MEASKVMAKLVYKFKGYTNTQMDELDAMLSRAGVRGTPDFNKMTYTVDMKGSNSFTLDKIMKRKGGNKIRENEMTIKDAFKDLVKKHGAKKALDILTSVLAPMGFEDPTNKKKFQKKLLQKVT